MTLMERAMEVHDLAMVSVSGSRGARFSGPALKKLEDKKLDVKTPAELLAVIEKKDKHHDYMLTKSERCEQFVLVNAACMIGLSYIDEKWLLADDDTWAKIAVFRDQKTANNLPTVCSAHVQQLLYQGEDFSICEQLVSKFRSLKKVRSIKALFATTNNEKSAAHTKGVYSQFKATRDQHARLEPSQFLALVRFLIFMFVCRSVLTDSC